MPTAYTEARGRGHLRLPTAEESSHAPGVAPAGGSHTDARRLHIVVPGIPLAVPATPRGLP